eukprot:TRINITY_DN12786_c0_g1_i1.p1 TRINITY_DN12786_c0_g1~~TRINITY_DN12786_c0_g1_i1.p1  ORF type:complete len:364 (+),score=51.73 TRINITY_DN12786_c0_g1_i1:109-1200(+)
MFLLQNNFFTEEKCAPILDRNDFLNPNVVDTVIQRTREWVSMTGSVKGFPVDKVQELDENYMRIIKHDAERTFVDPNRRKTLVRVVSNYVAKFSDYAQGLSHVCGFLLLTLTETEVSSIVTALATNPKYIPQYWCSEAIAAAKDAYVFEYLLQHHEPELASQFKKKGMLPEAYCPKWFVALNLNVLPYTALYRFFELFFEQGHLFLFKFCICYTSHFKDHLLNAKDHQIFDILRFDKSIQKLYDINSETLVDIVEGAASFKLIDIDVVETRTRLFKQYLEPRLIRAKLAQQQAAESDDEESGDGSDDEEEEEGAECGVCKKNMPGLWCTVCKVLMCERCHEGNKGKHKQTHKIDENWEKYDKK